MVQIGGNLKSRVFITRWLRVDFTRISSRQTSSFRIKDMNKVYSRQK